MAKGRTSTTWWLGCAQVRICVLVWYNGNVHPGTTAGFGHVAGVLTTRGNHHVAYEWVERWLGQPRYQRYISACNGDRARALALYEWNVSVGSALMRDIAHFEIALRNAYDAAFAAHWQGADHWLRDQASPIRQPIMQTRRIYENGARVNRRIDVNDHTRETIRKAIKKAGGQNAIPGKIIPELSFGFWASLTDKSREKPIWVPYVHHAFPLGTDRRDVDSPINNINAVRNRIAHHEPLFDCTNPAHEIPHIHSDLLHVLNLIMPDVADHIRKHSNVMAINSFRP